MKKGKKVKSQIKEPDRIVFFDILRIVFVAFIVYGHARFNLIPWFNSIFFADGYLPFNIYPIGLTGISVYGMIFVSGAVLEYNYKGIERFSDYSRFIFKRFIRLYPAFWMSLLLGILLFPAVLQTNFLGVIFEFSGFFVVLGEGPGTINPMGWFIAAIFSLYILFPYLSKMVKKYQLAAILSSLVMSYLSRIALLTYNLIPLNLLYYWFPLCNAFEFCLGIGIVQNKWYPKDVKDHPIIRKLSDLSFYVFLFHVIVINALISATYNVIAQGKGPVVYSIYYLGVMGTVLLVSWVAMTIDKKIQQTIMKSDRINNFLTS